MLEMVNIATSKYHRKHAYEHRNTAIALQLINGKRRNDAIPSNSCIVSYECVIGALTKYQCKRAYEYNKNFHSTVCS